MVFYRKYRPQNIEELDSGWVRQNLGMVLSSGRPPHAFLFTGPRGLGKTSAARIVAKSVNCVNNAYSKWRIANGKREKSISHTPQAISQIEPCNKCVVCVSITEGRNLDVLEIDAASNRGIDEIRDLREKIKLAPSSARFKVYIIDEVHMLTIEAFNALLKTLEEPPNHALFVLCTTEAQKLPPTITSRCLRFDFKRAGQDDLIRSMERIVKGEKIKIKREVLAEIARGADGSFRDAAKILEQAALSGREITQGQIKEILGETQNLKPEELLKFLAKKDARGALLEIQRLTEAGENLRVYTEKLLALLHQVLMVKVGVAEENGETELAQLWEKEEAVRLIELFSQAYQELKTAVIPQLPLELAVVEYCEEAKAGAPTNDFLDDIILAGPAARHLAGAHALTSGSAPARPLARVTRGGLPASSTAAPHRAQKEVGNISSYWPQIIEATKAYNHTLAGVLRGCRPQNFDGKILTIETFYQFHKDKLAEPKAREFLDKALSQVLGEKVVFKCVLGEKNTKK